MATNFSRILGDMKALRRNAILQSETNVGMVAQILETILEDGKRLISTYDDKRIRRSVTNEIEEIRRDLISSDIKAGDKTSFFIRQYTNFLNRLARIETNLQNERSENANIVANSITQNLPSISLITSALINANPLVGYGFQVVKDLYNIRNKKRRNAERRHEQRVSMLNEGEHALETSNPDNPQQGQLQNSNNQLDITNTLNSINSNIEALVNIFDGNPLQQSNSPTNGNLNNNINNNVAENSTNIVQPINNNEGDTQSSSAQFERIENISDGQFNTINHPEPLLLPDNEETVNNNLNNNQNSTSINISISNGIETANNYLERIASTNEHSNDVLVRMHDNEMQRLTRENVNNDTSELMQRESELERSNSQNNTTTSSSLFSSSTIDSSGFTIGGVVDTGVFYNILKPFKWLLRFLLTGGVMLSKFALIGGVFISIVNGIKGFFDGLINADKILGKDKADLTLFDKLRAAQAGLLAGVLSPLNWVLKQFGLGFAEDETGLRNKIVAIQDKVIEYVTNFFDNYSENVRKLTDKVANWIKSKYEAIKNFFTFDLFGNNEESLPLTTSGIIAGGMLSSEINNRNSELIRNQRTSIDSTYNKAAISMLDSSQELNRTMTSFPMGNNLPNNTIIAPNNITNINNQTTQMSTGSRNNDDSLMRVKQRNQLARF